MTTLETHYFSILESKSEKGINLFEHQQWQNNQIMVYYLWINKAVDKARTDQNICGCCFIKVHWEKSQRIWTCSFLEQIFLFLILDVSCRFKIFKKNLKDPEGALFSST